MARWGCSVGEFRRAEESNQKEPLARVWLGGVKIERSFLKGHSISLISCIK